MPAVTIDGKVIGRLTQEFATLQEALAYAVAWCETRGRGVDVTISLGAVPAWGLPSGGTYRLIVTAPDESGECGWSFTLVSEG